MKNTLTTGNWIILQDQPGLVYGNKPPLMIWLVAVNFRLLGQTTFAAKFSSCLFAVLSCVMTYLLGRRLFGSVPAVLAGCMAGVMPGVVTNAIDLRLDSAVTLYTVLSVYAAVRADQDGRPCWLLLAGLAMGLGLMTKAVAVAFCGVLLVVLLAIRRPRWLVHPYTLGAILLALLLATPWYLAVMLRESTDFAGRYFSYEVGRRIAFGPHVAVNLGANLLAVLKGSLPWWPAAAYAVWRWRGAEPAHRSGMLVAVIWIAEVVLLTTLPEKRYDRYVIPAYPAVALLAGLGASRLLPRRLHDVLPSLITRGAIAFCMVLALLPLQIHTRSAESFVRAKVLVDALAPGTTIAVCDPGLPQSLSWAAMERNWDIRASCIFYMDRTPVFYRTVDELAAAHEAFAIAREPDLGGLSERAYRAVVRLRERCYLVWCEPGGAGSSPE